MYCYRKVCSLYHALACGCLRYPPELAIGNVVRRVLYIIREEYMSALKTESENKSLDASQPPKSSAGGPPNSRNNYQSRSLGTILTPGTDTDLSIPITDLKLVRFVCCWLDYLSLSLFMSCY